MGKKFVIVESPHKAKTIKSFLKGDFVVDASQGHIRDLAVGNPKNHLGVDVNNNFEPIYEQEKKKAYIIAKLKKIAASCDEVYLATDPDREGEAISWHLAEVLHLDINTTKRLEFHEVTYHAIKNAIDNPRTINMDLVHSQESRRIIDRIIGFKLSNLVKKKIGAVSAGRVQSVVTRLVVERQQEVDNFVPEDYFVVNGTIKVDNTSVNVSLVNNDKEVIHFANKEEALEAINKIKEANIKFVSDEIEHKSRSSKPVYTTSTMQQDASTMLRFTSKKTMDVAQELYEGLDIGLEGGVQGLITYMRTDSIRITPEFINKTKAYINETYGENYVGVAKVFNNKDNVQDAHEGIRPTNIAITPSMLKEAVKAGKIKEEYEKLYTLIYNRTVASMMKDELYDKEEVLLEADNYYLLATGETTTFDGFTKVLSSAERIPLPIKISSESSIKVNKLADKACKTKGPSLFTEATLIAKMEQDGIGRPSTYATTLDTIRDHGYVKVIKNYYNATESGKLLVNKLIESFEEFIDVSYTANMETALDEIAQGKKEEKQYLGEFYSRFETLLKKAENEMEETVMIELSKLPTLGTCPTCGSQLVYRDGKNGKFIACSSYPKCKYTKSMIQNESEGTTCPNCNEGKLVLRKSASGQFLGCSCYPKCNYTKSIGFNKKSFSHKKKATYQNH